MMVSNGVSRSCVAGMWNTASAFRAISTSPSVTMAMTLPPRAFTSSTLLRILACTASFGATTTTGMFSSISAIGPCFISAAG